MACSRYLQEFGFITLWRFREPLFDFQRLEKYWRGNLSFGREVNFKFDKSSLNDSFGISCAKLGSKCFKSTYPQRRTSAEARSKRACRCPRRAINFVFRLNTRRWDLQRAEIHFQTASLSLLAWRARDRDSLIGFRARARCLSTHSVTEAIYRKFKLFCTRSRWRRDERRKGCRLTSEPRAIFSSNGRGSLVPYMPPPPERKINVPRPGTIFRGRIWSEIGGFSRRISAS